MLATIVGSANGRSISALTNALPRKSSRTSTHAISVPVTTLIKATIAEMTTVMISAARAAWAEAGFRPVDTTVFDKFTKDFPAPEKLWTIDDLGGWSKVNDELFDPDNGSVAKIYNKATG